MRNIFADLLNGSSKGENHHLLILLFFFSIACQSSVSVSFSPPFCPFLPLITSLHRLLSPSSYPSSIHLSCLPPPSPSFPARPICWRVITRDGPLPIIHPSWPPHYTLHSRARRPLSPLRALRPPRPPPLALSASRNLYHTPSLFSLLSFLLRPFPWRPFSPRLPSPRPCLVISLLLSRSDLYFFCFFLLLCFSLFSYFALPWFCCRFVFCFDAFLPFSQAFSSSAIHPA